MADCTLKTHICVLYILQMLSLFCEHVMQLIMWLIWHSLAAWLVSKIMSFYIIIIVNHLGPEADFLFFYFFIWNNHCRNSRDLECVFFSTLFSPIVIESSFPDSWPPTPFLLLPGQHHILYIPCFISFFLVVDIHVCIATVSIPALHGCDGFLIHGYFCLPLCWVCFCRISLYSNLNWER